MKKLFLGYFTEDFVSIRLEKKLATINLFITFKPQDLEKG